MGKVRLAYFIDHLKVGGAQRHLVEVLRHLDRARFCPQVWTLRGEGELIAEVAGLGVPVQSFGLGDRLQDPRSLPLFVRAIRRFRQEGVHIVHCYLSVANVVGTIVARLAQVPILLVSKRSLDQYKRRVEAWGHWTVNRLADRVTANAQAVKRFVIQEEGCPADKIVVIPNGVREECSAHCSREAERAALGIGPTEPVVGTIGRLAWKKGQAYLLEAAADVIQHKPETLFVLVGDGPLRQELADKAQALGIASRVRFLGQRLDTHAMLAVFDIFVLPSVIEGMSNALLEAQALAKPVVVTDVGGNAEIVLHEETGLVVPPRQPNVMAQALVRVLSDTRFAQRVGEAGRSAVFERFGFPAMLNAMQTLYEDLLKEKRVHV